MHLLPSSKLRESLSYQYLRKLEWNTRKMNIDKRRRLSSKSLENETLLNNEEIEASSSETPRGWISALWEKIFIVLYCFSCCCFFQELPWNLPRLKWEMNHPVKDADEFSPFGSFSPDEFYARHSVTHGSNFITNSRGLKLFTQWWIPRPPTKLLGIVAVVHGFTGESSWLIQLTAVFFAKAGFATCSMDHQGHGFSEGLDAYIPDANPVIDDCIAFFDNFRHHFPDSLPSFLYAESLGGAVALFITLRQNKSENARKWNGVILNGAMCGINEKVKPPWIVQRLLFMIASLVPTWRLVPSRSLVDLSLKVEWKRKLAEASPRKKSGWPRLGTAAEMLRMCEELQARFDEVEVPLLIVHGGDDVVCNPAVMEELHRRARSEDKTLKIYPNMWHLLIGEADENVNVVFADILDWLRSRAKGNISR